MIAGQRPVMCQSSVTLATFAKWPSNVDNVDIHNVNAYFKSKSSRICNRRTKSHFKCLDRNCIVSSTRIKIWK